jgi:hypothetical protein
MFWKTKDNRTNKEKILEALKRAGQYGLSQGDLIRINYRFGAYIDEIRNDLGDDAVYTVRIKGSRFRYYYNA